MQGGALHPSASFTTWKKVSFFICILFKVSFFKKKRFYLFIFRERGGEEEREGEKHQCVVASHTPPTGDLAHNPGVCPDWESNWRPFGLQASAQPPELHQTGLKVNFNSVISK